MLYLFGYSKDCITNVYRQERSALNRVKKEKCSGINCCLYAVPESALTEYNIGLVGKGIKELYANIYRKGAKLFFVDNAYTNFNISDTKEKFYIDLKTFCPCYCLINSDTYLSQVKSLLIEKLLVLKARKAIKENNINKPVGIRLNGKVVISDVMKINGGK